MSKYIIDTDKHVSPFDGLILTSVGGLEELNSEYVFAHFGEEIGVAEDRAARGEYERGYKDGMDFSIGDAEKKKAYEDGYKACETKYCSRDACVLRREEYDQGLEDARNILLRIFEMDPQTRIFTFNISDPSPSVIFNDYTMPQIIAMINDYEAKKNTFNIGDEVLFKGTGEKYYIYKINEQTKEYFGYSVDQHYSFNMKRDDMIKTGNHSDILSGVIGLLNPSEK